MYRWMIILALLVQTTWMGNAFASANLDEGMKYFTPLSEEEVQSIDYIISTLSNKSTLSLLRYRKQLEIAGSKTVNVHPLRFWKQVLSDQNLRSGLPKMGSIPRKQLINDFAIAFDAVNRSGWMREEYIEDFCSATGVPKEVFYSYAQQGKWADFLGSFFKYS